MGVAPEMTCSEFDKAFDPYVDGLLDPLSAAAARMHLESCPTCDRMVARWQQSRILLSTAVAEIAAAVDVSGLFTAVGSALDAGCELEDGALTRPSVTRGASHQREFHAERGGVSASVDIAARTARPAARMRRFSAIGRFVAVAGGSAVAAAASIMLLAPGMTLPVQVATETTPSTFSLGSSLRLKPVTFTAPERRDGGVWRPLLPVPALVDALEAGEGRTVSTWVQPRTQTRVIWVQSRNSGPTLQTAGYDK
ncbi:MAG: zf-HC2 domain-containing protein [Deltaproteobacteria bacterium]|nr:zf-HC2 domain-containing protein [Deltaproteobacteria bacterium]